MKKSTSGFYHFTIGAALLALVVAGCQDPAESLERAPQARQSENAPKTEALPPGGGVMMQAFYWDVPAGGTWWNTVRGKIDSWSAAGITAIWLPPVSKAQNGPFSMGYDPADYFDFGQYSQNGSVETRFGSEEELKALMARARSRSVEVYADIVLNHNSGGNLEWNPYANRDTYTEFKPASGKFFRSYNDFHPNGIRNNDEGIFGGFPDLSHATPYVQDWLWRRDDGVAKYYKNTLGFSGWRFDYVKGFGTWVVRDWMRSVGGFAVGEYWDANVNLLKGWVDGTGRTASAFDFACYYKMDEAFDGNNLNRLNEDMLWKRDATKAVTFVANHDTDIIWNKYLAYAYILTHEGYPTLFYRDYEEWLDKDRLDNLVWIHGQKAVGTTSNLYTDNDEYIARRNGNPGLVVYLNNADSWQERWVSTNWRGRRVKDFTGSSSWEPVTANDGRVKIQAPPKGYTIWSLK